MAPSEAFPIDNGREVVEFEHVTKKYESTVALQDLTFLIERGQVVGVLGPNGAGKTTAVRLMLGLMKPNRGTVRVLGGDPRQHTTRTRIGAMLQVAKVPETLRVREHIRLFSTYYARPLPIGETLHITGLEEVADRQFGQLSGGQKQRLLFALAICGDADLVLLDEPTVGLDVEARRSLWERIRTMANRGKTVVLTTHYLEEADALSDRIVLLDHGRIVAQGTPCEIKTSIGGKRIRCVTRLSAEDVRLLFGVVAVSKDRGALEIRAADPDRVIRELLARDPGVSGIEVQSTKLDDAFLALTQNEQDSLTEVRR
jgi:ABC-2 type transport system ATP-binding protein